MTSSKSNGNYDSMIEKLLERFDSGADIGRVAQEILDTLLKMTEVITGLKANSKIENKTQANTIIKLLADELEARGIKGTVFSKHLGTLRTGMGARVDRGDIVKLIDLVKSVVYVLQSDVVQSKMAQTRGSKQMNINASSMDSQLVQQILKSQKINSLQNMSLWQRWIVGFANGLVVNEDKKKKGLVHDIINGLAANKFVGGALKDTTRLMGLLAGNWIKNNVKGPLGGLLAGGAYIISEIVATVVPLVLAQLVHGAFQGLIQGWVMGTIGKGAAGGATQLGATALLGATGATGTAKTLRVVNGQDALKQAIANKKATSRPSVFFNGQKFTQSSNGFYLPDHSVQKATINSHIKLRRTLGNVAKATNKNTVAVSKTLQPLSKILNSPFMKIGGKLLGGAFAVAAGASALGEGYSAFQDFKQGNKAGGIWHSIAGVSDIATIFAPGWWKLLTLTVSLFSHWMAAKSDEQFSASKGLLGASGSFPSSPSVGTVNARGASSNLQVAGGRSHVSRNLVNALSSKTNVSKDAQAFMKNQEGIRLWAYDDKTGKRLNKGDKPVGTPTIGHGHTLGVVPGMTITQAQANKFFNNDLWEAKGRLRKAFKMHGISNGSMPQEIYDMLVDAHFQAGYLPLGTKSSQPTALVGYIKQGNWEAVSNYLSTFKHSSSTRNNARAAFIRDHKVKAIPSGKSVDIASPETVTESVKAPQSPEETKEEPKNEVAEAIKSGFSEALKEVNSLKETKETSDNKFQTGLADSIARSSFSGLDVPANDTAFSVLTKLNNIDIFGGQ